MESTPKAQSPYTLLIRNEDEVKVPKSRNATLKTMHSVEISKLHSQILDHKRKETDDLLCLPHTAKQLVQKRLKIKLKKAK